MFISSETRVGQRVDRARDGVSELERGAGWNWTTAIVSVLVCQSAGVFGALASAGGARSAWYRALRKPAFNPPPRVFGIVWPTLYFLMGCALHDLWGRRRTAAGAAALRWFGVNLVLNAAWSPVFFMARSIRGAVAIIGGMLGSLVPTMAFARRRSPRAVVLLLPYLIWTGFAAVLNGAILDLNPKRR